MQNVKYLVQQMAELLLSTWVQKEHLIKVVQIYGMDHYKIRPSRYKGGGVDKR